MTKLCELCLSEMTPVDVMLGPVCGKCVRKQHELAVAGKPPLRPKGKAYFSPASGEEDRYGYAIKIDGIENDFPRQPFGRQVDAHRAVQQFKATAKSTWIGTKRRKGQRPLTEIKRWIKAANPTQFYARWPTSVDDDSAQVWYMEG